MFSLFYLFNLCAICMGNAWEQSVRLDIDYVFQTAECNIKGTSYNNF